VRQLGKAPCGRAPESSLLGWATLQGGRRCQRGRGAGARPWLPEHGAAVPDGAGEPRPDAGLCTSCGVTAPPGSTLLPKIPSAARSPCSSDGSSHSTGAVSPPRRCFCPSPLSSPVQTEQLRVRRGVCPEDVQVLGKSPVQTD